eukprot:NODE_249_length_12946_cov_0.357438.p8 type:complete len:279 gc:universal NODE_249_length_12946_cov_0.357438:10575-9739(-)
MKATDAFLIAGKRDKTNKEQGTEEIEFEEQEAAKAGWKEMYTVNPEDSKIKKFRKIVFGTLDDLEYSKSAKIISIILAFIIIGSILEFILETMHILNSSDEQQAIFNGFELFFNITFSVDYFAKVLLIPDLAKLPNHLIKPSSLIDLMSILPFYIQIFTENSSDVSILRVVRLVRILRIFRLFKLSKNMKQVKMVVKAMSRSREAILMLVFLLINGLFIFGSFVYFSEAGISTLDTSTGLLVYTSGTLNGSVSTFQSIPHTMWWAIVTLTTVFFFSFR